jgi:tRNA(Ile2) C34 agmatinyltransferase TiaS
MKVYVGFDDTDNADADRGTGKLARWFERELPDGCFLEGALRQQLLVHEDIPYTSHNSSACLIVNAPDASFVKELIDRAVKHVEKHALEGSDPGVCVAYNGNGGMQRLMEFGRECTARIITQGEAMEAANGFHLSGHGGTNDGIIGAAAAVGLSASGWSGRFIEYGRLRDFPDPIRVSELERSHILVVSVDRDAKVPAPGDLVRTKGWLRPRLWGGRAVLLVIPISEGVWESVGGKRKDQKSQESFLSSSL